MDRWDTPRQHGPGMSLGECQVALDAARQEAAELRDKYLRAEAEIENTRKRAERDAAAQVTRRMRDFSARLLDVADNLERALAHAPEGDALRPGVRATLQLLQTALRQEGIVPLAVKIGAPFDPQLHEAVGGYTSNVTRESVAEITQTGYTFDGQLLRPARVVVALPEQANES